MRMENGKEGRKDEGMESSERPSGELTVTDVTSFLALLFQVREDSRLHLT